MVLLCLAPGSEHSENNKSQVMMLGYYGKVAIQYMWIEIGIKHQDEEEGYSQVVPNASCDLQFHIYFLFFLKFEQKFLTFNVGKCSLDK